MEPSGVTVPEFPAAIPATFDPCPSSSSAVRLPELLDDRKDLATITLLFASDPLELFERGKPAGALKPASENIGFVISIPVSRMAILTPAPALDDPPSRSHIAGAPMSCTLASNVACIRLTNSTCFTPGSAAIAATSLAGASTDTALATVLSLVLTWMVGDISAARD